MRLHFHPRLVLLALAAAVFVFVAVGCGRESEETSANQSDAASTLSGKIEADGSSTVGPLVTAAAELFQEENSDVQVTVGISGTGGGFERFCAGETDLSNASRPIKDDEEAPLCLDAGIEYTDFQVATDALTVVVNPENDWVDCLTTDQLKKMWEPAAEGKVKTWQDVDPSFPDEPLVLSGPGTDSGTFDYFTDEINGEEGASRADFQASEDDNVIVEAVAGEKGGLGYFGFSYFEQNQDALKALAIDSGAGCIEPSAENAQAGEYTPLARPLFVYTKNEALARPEVEEFIRYMLDNNQEITETALFIPLTDEQLTDGQAKLDGATG
ncbi:MAG: PstS family phosphate ABC transporter substrate-binding protein [Gaiellaceae bacterium]